MSQKIKSSVWITKSDYDKCRAIQAELGVTPSCLIRTGLAREIARIEEKLGK